MRKRRRSSPSKRVWFSVTFDDSKDDTTTIALTGKKQYTRFAASYMYFARKTSGKRGPVN